VLHHRPGLSIVRFSVRFVKLNPMRGRINFRPLLHRQVRMWRSQGGSGPPLLLLPRAGLAGLTVRGRHGPALPGIFLPGRPSGSRSSCRRPYTATRVRPVLRAASGGRSVRTS
jgi:hypothetical protein